MAEVSGSLLILRNSALLSLEGLNQVTKIAGNVTVSENWRLWSLEGCNSLRKVGGSLALTSNRDLLSMEGFNSLVSCHSTPSSLVVLPFDERGSSSCVLLFPRCQLEAVCAWKTIPCWLVWKACPSSHRSAHKKQPTTHHLTPRPTCIAVALEVRPLFRQSCKIQKGASAS